jgi:hypothetical protein
VKKRSETRKRKTVFGRKCIESVSVLGSGWATGQFDLVTPSSFFS